MLLRTAVNINGGQIIAHADCCFCGSQVEEERLVFDAGASSCEGCPGGVGWSVTGP